MAQLSQAEQYLFERISNGDADAWSNLVERYQGRLLAFASSRLSQPTDAEDIVQETFLAFVTSLPKYRQQASIETFLFSILRRKIVDVYRGRKLNPTLIQDTLAADDNSASPDPFQNISGQIPTPSTYARREEQTDQQRIQLAAALENLLADTKKKLNFRDIQIAELIFYSQLRNKQIAQLMQIDEKHIALIKHRLLKRIKSDIDSAAPTGQQFPIDDALLTDVWEHARPSCPKRSTIGKYLLKTLDSEWHNYVEFHLSALGCRFCRANLQDLENKTAPDQSAPFKDRVFQSTVGFLSKH